MFSVSVSLMIITFFCVEGKVITDQNEWNNCCPQCPWGWPYESDVRPICQYYDNNPYYATLYNVVNRIPMFSQFALTNKPVKGERIEFAVEPQLINFNQDASQNMEQEEDLTASEKKDLGKNQATLEDYKQGSIYDKGHLNLAAGHRSSDESKATFTLTNAVPQVGSFNQGCWVYMEEAMLKYVKTCYPNTIVVGAVPGFGSKMNGRVNVPAYMWNTIQCQGSVVAFLAPNVQNGQIEQNKLMTLFFFKENILSDFTTSIKALYNAQNQQELDNSVQNLKTDSQYFESNPPKPFTSSKPLNRCLAPYGVRMNTILDESGYDEL